MTRSSSTGAGRPAAVMPIPPGDALSPRCSGAPAALSRIVGESPAMKTLLDQARRVANHNLPLLILGESGTGKELLARAIHEEGHRGRGPFVPVNCTAVPTDLLESELFGHVRGAFTGATADRKGLMEEAGGGTFFLDELGDLGPGIQAKLLRVLQDGEIRRVGENSSRHVNFRLIAATNRNLRKDVASGRFRLDLYFRVGVVELVLPPLRQRCEDIPLLIDHFCRRLNNDYGFCVQSIERRALDALLEYHWPGNVRELENVIHSTLVMMEGRRVLQLDDLPPVVRKPVMLTDIEDDELSSGGLPLKLARKEFDRRYVTAVLERHAGNRTRSASAMGISRQALLKMLKRLGLVSSDAERRTG